MSAAQENPRSGSAALSESASVSTTIALPCVEQIEARILSRVAGRVQNLQVVLRENGVILQGRARTYHVKQLAQHAVLELPGVRLLANDIEVA
jgi:osmotically-inducible protein OsmY